IIASMKELVFQNVWTSPFNELVCEESGYSEATMAFWRLVTYYQQFLVFFLLPLLMVIYCYVCITVRVLSTRMKEKCRAVKLIFVIIFTFFVCWTPYNVVILLKAIQSSGPDVECAESDKLD
ncbi:C-C chemokine receptor type 3-like, partial [Hippocampus comes]|uniref:C-C chemokine receptor type 3-like n=1 Tax=Hippocampus comes TaxID=109280 RepID=UPI00094E0926